ncbi:MAG: CehA/McbA family metallohydrolase, partial [Acidobacteria bacterium]|nr:CehA/McbA family metallohydrolase [Acidobacteriota bacterium]
FRPGGRTIRCLVSRVTRRGENSAAGARLLVTPLDGAAAVDLSPGSSHPLFPWPEPRRRSFIIARAGEAEFYLPEGRYRIVASGGLLDGLDIWETPLRGDAEHRFVVRRQVELPGTVAVDFHVHAAPSIDSVIPMMDQLAAFQAAGVDLLVASDHNIVTDYRPLIASLPAASGHIRSLPGVEVSLRAAAGDSYGHWNVWPLVPDAQAPPVRVGQITSFGALAIPPVPTLDALRRGTPVAEMYDAYRSQAARLAGRGQDAEILADMLPIIQVNHPRGFQNNPHKNVMVRRHDWFNKAGFLPGGAWPDSFYRESAAGTTSLDFDALEIWNRSSRRLYEQVRADWFTFLNHGVVRTATANSDSHTQSPELAGYPLNLVLLPAGRPHGPQVEVRDLMHAVRSGRVIGTDGPVPLLSVRAGGVGAGPGETLQATDGEVRVRLEVLAADWVPVGEMRLWVNGQVAARGTGKLLETTLHLPRDSWLVAEVGDLEGVPEETILPGLYGELVPRGMALGFTNPVFVDVDGNGRYDAAGGLP